MTTAFYPITNKSTVETDGYFEIPGNFTAMFYVGFDFVAIDSGSGSPQLSSYTTFTVANSSYTSGRTRIYPGSGSPLTSGSPLSSSIPSPAGQWVTLAGGDYALNHSDTSKSTIHVSVAGENNTDTSLVFPGRASFNYGVSINENFLHLLENFANLTPPDASTEGQLWYNNASSELYIHNDAISPVWDLLLTESIGDATYLRLDGTNDPVTGDVTFSLNVTADKFLGGSSGTAGAPTFSWSGDTDTGAFNPSDGTIRFVSNGIEQIEISGDLLQFFTTSQGSPGSAELRVSVNDEGAVIIEEVTTLPVSTTDKLYNSGGDLYWNGSNLVTSSSTSLGDLDDVDDDVSDGSPLPTIGDVLTWNGAEWTNTPPGTGLGVLYDEIIVNGSPLPQVFSTTNVILQQKSPTTAFQQVFRNGILQRESLTGSPADGNYTIIGSPTQIQFLIPLTENDEIIIYQL